MFLRSAAGRRCPRSGLTVASGATLAGAGTIAGSGTATLGAGAILAPGNNATTGNVGTLNVPNMVLAGSGTAYFDLSGTTTTAGNGVNDLVTVGGNFTLGGTTAVFVNLISGTSLVSGGTYSLFAYTGSALGAAASASLALADPGVLSGRQSYRFDTSHAGAVNLDITGGPASLNWAGSNAASWDNSGGTTNWFNFGTSQSDRFYAGDYVSFTNSRSGTITINAAVQPGSIAVSGNYTFSGTGTITGRGGADRAKRRDARPGQHQRLHRRNGPSRRIDHPWHEQRLAVGGHARGGRRGKSPARSIWPDTVRRSAVWPSRRARRPPAKSSPPAAAVPR